MLSWKRVGTVKWTTRHTSKAQQANMTVEPRQIALGTDVAHSVPPDRGEGDGASFALRDECSVTRVKPEKG